MAKYFKKLKAAMLSSISKKYVEDNELIDPPARLFRALLHKLEMNPHKWTNYVRDYLEWSVTNEDKEKLKTERNTRSGNIKEIYFHKPTLTFNKMLEGVSILRMVSCEVIVRTVDEDGNVYEVSDVMGVMGKDRGPATQTNESSDE